MGAVVVVVTGLRGTVVSGVTGAEVVMRTGAGVTRTGDGVTSGVGVMITGAGVTGAIVVAGEMAVVWMVTGGMVVAGSVTTGGACMRRRPLPDDAKITSDANNENAICFNMMTTG